MRFARALAVAGIATAALLGTAGTASADLADVKTGNDGNCYYPYAEWAQAGTTTVCVHFYIPEYEVRTTSTPCRTGYTEYTLFNTYGVCVDWVHN